jgi:hypothetical protein
MERGLFGKIIPIATFCLGMLTMSFINKKEKVIIRETVKHVYENANVETDSVELSGITGTYYHAVAAQCDATPLITADNSKIDLVKLKDKKIRWVALSRDLLARWGGPFNYGDTIKVSQGSEKVNGLWVVHDSMNRRFKNRIDFLVHKSHKFPGKSRNLVISKI